MIRRLGNNRLINKTLPFYNLGRSIIKRGYPCNVETPRESSDRLYKEKCNLERNLCEARSLLSKFANNLKFTKDDNVRLKYHLEKHKEHRNSDFQAELNLELTKLNKLNSNIDKIVKLGGKPSEKLLQEKRYQARRVVLINNVDKEDLNFLDRDIPFVY